MPPGTHLAHALLISGLLLLGGCDTGTPPAPVKPPEPGAAERLARARTLMAEAGFPDGKGFPRLEILYNTMDSHKTIAAAIQQMWRKNLGIDVELRNTEWKVYLDDMSKLRYQIVRRGWIGDYRDPNTFVEMFTSHSGNNNTGWKSEGYDRLVKRAAAEPDPAKRIAFLQQAEEILLRDVPILPIYFYVSQACWKDRVKGVWQNIQDIHPLHEVVAEGKETLVINNGTEIQTLDPGLARGVPEHRVLQSIFQGLTSLDPKTLDPRPGVAEKWEISPDGKTYTFTLRECAWTDGKPVTANDFEYAWKRVLNPSTPTDYAHQLLYIKGAEAYNSKKTDDPETVGVKAKEDRTLVVELENPCTFFLDLCAFFTYYPVRKDVIEKHGTNWTRAANIVSNGPFMLKEWLPTESITVVRNPKYWNAKVVKQPAVKFLPIENAGSAWNEYLKGDCDWVTTLPLGQIEEIMKRPDYHGDTYLGTYFYSFNVTEGVLKDRRVRLALNLAIDREIITEKITRQGQKPAYGLVPPAWPEYKGTRIDTVEAGE